MWAKKTVLVLLPKVLLVTTSFCISQVQTEKNLVHHRENKSQSPCENTTKTSVSPPNAFIYLRKTLWVAFFRSGLEENVWKSTYDGARLVFETRRDEDFSIQKSHFVKNLVHNFTRFKKFPSKNWFFKINIDLNLFFFSKKNCFEISFIHLTFLLQNQAFKKSTSDWKFVVFRE